MLLCVIQQLGTRASARLRTSVEASFQDCIASLAGACVPTVFRFSSSTKLRDCALRPIDRIWMDITAAVPRTWLDLAVAGGGTCRRVGLGGWVAGWGGGAGGRAGSHGGWLPACSLTASLHSIHTARPLTRSSCRNVHSSCRQPHDPLVLSPAFPPRQWWRVLRPQRCGPDPSLRVDGRADSRSG